MTYNKTCRGITYTQHIATGIVRAKERNKSLLAVDDEVNTGVCSRRRGRMKYLNRIGEKNKIHTHAHIILTYMYTYIRIMGIYAEEIGNRFADAYK